MQHAGINIGYGHTKLRTSRGYQSFPSIIAKSNDKFIGMGEKRNTIRTQFAGAEYEIGEDAALLHNDPTGGKICVPRWMDSLNYQVLRQATIDILSQESKVRADKDWALVLGVAVEHYEDQQYIEELLQVWRGPLVGSHGTINVAEVQAFPEPLGAYWRLKLADSSLRDTELDLVVVIDLGYFTTDWLTISRDIVLPEKSGGVDQGMFAVYQAMQEILHRDFGITPDLVKIERQVRQGGNLQFARQSIDRRLVLQPALDQVLPRIMAAVRKSLGDTSSEQPLFFLTGGGASFLRAYLRKTLIQPVIHVSSDSQRDNAEGYWMIARTLEPASGDSA